MIDRKQIVIDSLGSKVTLKFHSREPESSIVDMLADFTRINYSVNVESFTIKTQTVTHYDINRRICDRCGSIKPASQSCGCFDNGAS